MVSATLAQVVVRLSPHGTVVQWVAMQDGGDARLGLLEVVEMRVPQLGQLERNNFV